MTPPGAGANLQEDSVSHPAAVSALECGACWGPDGVESSTALNCAAWVGECDGGAGLAGTSRSGDCAESCDNCHQALAINTCAVINTGCQL